MGSTISSDSGWAGVECMWPVVAPAWDGKNRIVFLPQKEGVSGMPYLLSCSRWTSITGVLIRLRCEIIHVNNTKIVRSQFQRLS